MASVEVLGVELDPLPDFLRSEDDSVDGYPGDTWLWRELGSPRVAGGYKKNRYKKDSTPSALCEPVSESLTVDLFVGNEGSVGVKFTVGSAAQPWSLSLWEIEGLVRMGEARQARVRRKHASIKERLRIASNSSSDIPAKVYCEESNVSRGSGEPSQSMSTDEDSKHLCASSDLLSLDSAREDKPKTKNILVNEAIKKKESTRLVPFRLGKAFSFNRDYEGDIRSQGKSKWASSKGRLLSRTQSCNRTNFSWNVIMKNMLCCVHGE